jgi:tellurite resistance protein
MSPNPSTGVLAQVTAPPDTATQSLSRLVGVLAEDAIFALAGSADGGFAILASLARRRADAYAACIRGDRVPRMVEAFDAWVIEMARAIAPLAPPVWMPMGDVVAEGVTLEIGARGLRSLFSSKPSDKDMQRVKRLGTLAVRVLRAVLAADGNVDAEEARTIAALVASMGLPAADAAPLLTEEVVSVEHFDVYGDVEPSVAKALVRGAWLAAAWDTLDPREEHVVKTLAGKLSLSTDDVETARAEAVARVDARRLAGLAAVDLVRYVLSDRIPGPGVPLAANAGTLLLPRRYREEALAQLGHGAPVTLARRYMNLPAEDRAIVLGIVWAAAIHDDPSMGRLAVLRARYDKAADDLAEDGTRPRQTLSDWVGDALANAVGTMG